MESLIILISGTVVGLVAGLFGVGGSFLLVPLLTFATNVPAEILIGSCACQVLGPATAAILSYRIRLKELQIPFILLGGIVSGTLMGARGLQAVNDYGDADSVSSVVQMSYLLLIWSLGLFSLWEANRHRRMKPISIGWLTMPWIKPTLEVFGRQRRHAISIVALSLFGVIVGLLSGFLGLSGGVILVPGLHYLFGIPTKRSARLSMILVGMIAVQAIFIHAGYHRIDLKIVGMLLVGGTVGAQVGVILSDRTTGGTLRKQFAWLLLASALGLTGFFLFYKN
ncbi:sulfite exporter TauE/SafE family protein [Rubinisphaera sp. JC750]|uniref:sulfite exporter TauE/SafE family protein n=1 Tax=Rubinisphaera sp. JC750 TaxID=2898658 RepID=UPI001F3FE3D9|nr:sulfite exporter TauE/SafE family protein [Rubinisphaera sp. JC750]